MMDETITYALTQVAYQIPMFIVWTVCIVLALVFWRHHPKVSLLAMIAAAGLLFVRLVGVIIHIVLSRMMFNDAISHSSMGTIFGIWNVIAIIMNIIFWVLLIFAIFGWRRNITQQ
ncbi:hypothetical protein JXJ21_24040 [candidate division KSB1 bacterium]|nr:hypothetical protein [candidate division KSB1 bacterium]